MQNKKAKTIIQYRMEQNTKQMGQSIQEWTK